MKHARLVIAAAAFLGALQAAPAAAQRVFVAAQGSDANPCTFALPCRTFQHAHDTVAAGGEIDVLDPAGYGMLTITKAISIQGHGFAGISVAVASNGVTINAGANDAVSLNGLLIEGSRAGDAGIVFNSGKSLVIENCIARNMSGPSGIGLAFLPSAATPQTLSVSNSLFTDNHAAGITIDIRGAGAATAAITRTVLDGNFIGLGVLGVNGTGPLDVSVADSVANNSGAGFGFSSQSSAGHAAANLVLTRVVAVGNGTGISTFGPNATIRFSDSTVTGNTKGFAASGGSIVSYGDNYIIDNGSNVGALDTAVKQ
jgi:hypothetical protein